MENLLSEGLKPFIIAGMIVIMVVITAKLLKGILNTLMWLIIGLVICIMLNYYSLPLLGIEPLNLGLEGVIGKAKTVGKNILDKRDDVEATIEKAKRIAEEKK